MAAATEGTPMTEQEITLTEILAAREERVAIQNALLAEYKAPVVSFTMNIAGPVKVTDLTHRAFLWGMDQLRLGFLQNKMKVRKEFSRSLSTGDEGYFSVDAPAERVKSLCVRIEEDDQYLGRFFDMDVIGLDGCKLERGAERACIVCGKPGRDCASRRLHTVTELQTATASNLRSGFLFLDREKLAALATRALLEEVAVTPKPGLVDRANSGAHRDMDFFSFQASAAALSSYWGRCFYENAWRKALRIPPDSAEAQTPSETFAALRPLGMTAEREMLLATGGVNTHKGAIFTLGVLCGAIGRLWTAEDGFPDADSILKEAAAMTRETLAQELPAAHWNTAGEGLYQKYGVRGIRGQVADGLPAVRNVSLPAFRALLARGLDRNHAASVTLLHLIAAVEDTNLLHRGGPDGAAWAQAQAKSLLAGSEPPTPAAIAALDGAFIKRNLSPGGCADLLAVTLFLDSLETSARRKSAD